LSPEGRRLACPGKLTGGRRSMKRTILVAADGTPAALGALRYAANLSEEKGHEVHVLGVVEPVPVFDAGFMVAIPEAELYESRRDALREALLDQVRTIAGHRDRFPVVVQAGVPGTRIVQFAEDIRAEGILLGLGRHGPMDRMFGTETALQVLRISHLPVLAVPEDHRGLPHSAVLGVDFSIFSQRAAQTVTSILASPWELHLVHVLSGMEFLPTLSEEWRDDYEEELTDRLEAVARELQDQPSCEIRSHILEGEPSHELLSFAKSKQAGLLVAGSHGHSFVGRLLMGSVSTRLIRSAHIPVLVVPPPERSMELLESPGKDSVQDWAAQLQEFTRANAGRRTTLVLEDPEMGKQECGRDFPLWGVDYDPRRDRIDIMLGRWGTVEGHLTHSLTGPRELEIVRAADGRFESLHIRLPVGRAVLRVHRDPS
jgi:nucleotide-binding universal stress UspA family protein